MKARTVLAMLPLVTLAACASLRDRESDVERLERYTEHAGAPVDSFTYLGRIDGWQALGRDRLLVRTGVNDAYLLTVAPPCTDLPFATAIGLTSTGHTVSSRFDSVRVGGDRCQITEIRPVDYGAVKREARAASQQDKTG
jgi:hypothetical protein